jgi:hypothetical protein
MAPPKRPHGRGNGYDYAADSRNGFFSSGRTFGRSPSAREFIPSAISSALLSYNGEKGFSFLVALLHFGKDNRAPMIVVEREANTPLLLEIAQLPQAHLDGQNLHRAHLEGKDLHGISLRNADVRNALLMGANLREADFTEACLANAILDGAILTHAVLHRAILTGASFKGARLEQANLSKARILFTDFSGAFLKDVNLDGASYDESTLWPKGFIPEEFGAHKVEIG